MQQKTRPEEKTLNSESLRIAEAVRAACINAALAGYEDASMRGLCHEGAWECAIGAIRMLDVRESLTEHVDKSPCGE